MSENTTSNNSATVTQETSAARIAANRANSLKSTGPTSPAGVAAIRLNALKSALTGLTVLLHTDDAALYAEHLRNYQLQYQPVGPEECALVQSIADIRWRLNRIPGLEMAIISVGRIELEAENPDGTTLAGESLCLAELQIRRDHEKELRNLHLQENRLARRREKDVAELPPSGRAQSQ